MGLGDRRLRAYNAVVRIVQARTRSRRMQVFAERLAIEDGARILDLGGNPRIWNLLPQRLHLTILNLPGDIGREIESHHDIRFVEGDACEAKDLRDFDFDVVFSNSVIEHVGDEERQLAFARTVRRLARRFWVQTPARCFPIEAHTGMPFWWFYPESVRVALLERWHRKLPAWSESMAATRVLSRNDLERLFPGARIYVEWLLGIPKSYAAYAAGSEPRSRSRSWRTA